jgi:hypothetical protein
MWKARFTAALFFIAAIASGDDLTTIDGKEYKQISVNRVEPDGIVITHSTGVAKILFTELSNDAQKRFGYDATKIEADRARAKAAEEERSKYRGTVEQSAQANLRKSVQQFDAAEKRAREGYENNPRGTLSGQVFVATKGGENVKLGALQVSLFAGDAIDGLLAGLKEFADAKIEQLPITGAAAAQQKAEAALEQAKRVEQQAKATVKEAELKEKADWEYYEQSVSSNDARNAAYASREATKAAKEAANSANEAVKAAEKAANAAGQEYRDLIQQRAFYYSAAFYFIHLRSPIQTAETDGEGRFTMEIPRTGAFVISTHGERGVLGKETERYYWLQTVSLEGKQEGVQNLSNSNLTRTTGTSSLILTRD